MGERGAALEEAVEETESERSLLGASMLMLVFVLV